MLVLAGNCVDPSGHPVSDTTACFDFVSGGYTGVAAFGPVIMAVPGGTAVGCDLKQANPLSTLDNVVPLKQNYVSRSIIP